MSVGSADLGALAASFAKSAKDIDRVADAVLSDAASKIETRMKELAPKKTGRLYMSIRTIKEGHTYRIGPVGVDYALYQEFGTATRGEFGGQPYVIKPIRADKLVFKINGKWISTKKVIHPGIPPHPYIRPALAEYINGIPSDMAREAANLTLGGKP